MHTNQVRIQALANSQFGTLLAMQRLGAGEGWLIDKAIEAKKAQAPRKQWRDYSVGDAIIHENKFYTVHALGYDSGAPQE